MRSDYEFLVVWSGSHIAREYGFTEPGELIPRELRAECSALATLMSPKELDEIETRQLTIIDHAPGHHREPEAI